MLTSTAMQEALDQAPWDVAICDWTLPQEIVEAQELAVLDRDSGVALRVVASVRPMHDDDGRQWGALAVIRECRDAARSV